jgi:hypothetical protein
MLIEPSGLCALNKSKKKNKSRNVQILIISTKTVSVKTLIFPKLHDSCIFFTSDHVTQHSEFGFTLHLIYND